MNDIQNFLNTMPFHDSPYSKRNWGHSWHSLCSYRGKLKPSIAYFLVHCFTKKGDVVVDPLCGVGTIPFEACLQGRIGIGNDLSALAYVVTKSKLEKPDYNECISVLNNLENYINKLKNSREIQDDFNRYFNFGLVGKIGEYFEENTLKELLCARRFFTSFGVGSLTSAETTVFSCLLHTLHGNRPYVLSRWTNALVAFRPKGEFEYKNVVEHTKNKLDLSYKKGDFNSYTKGKAYCGDYINLPHNNIKADVIITSPPFADSFCFYRQNWLRLWLCGWNENDYKNADILFIDKKQLHNFNVYISFFEMCYELLKDNGTVILHLGKTDKVDMAEELSKRTSGLFTEIGRGEENVVDCERFGIRDHGKTTKHQFLFLKKK